VFTRNDKEYHFLAPSLEDKARWLAALRDTSNNGHLAVHNSHSIYSGGSLGRGSSDRSRRNSMPAQLFNTVRRMHTRNDALRGTFLCMFVLCLLIVSRGHDAASGHRRVGPQGEDYPCQRCRRAHVWLPRERACGQKCMCSLFSAFIHSNFSFLFFFARPPCSSPRRSRTTSLRWASTGN